MRRGAELLSRWISDSRIGYTGLHQLSYNPSSIQEFQIVKFIVMLMEFVEIHKDTFNLERDEYQFIIKSTCEFTVM